MRFLEATALILIIVHKMITGNSELHESGENLFFVSPKLDRDPRKDVSIPFASNTEPDGFDSF